MGTWEHSLFSSQPLSISSSCWLWVEVSDLYTFLHFRVFQLWHFGFSLIKAPLVLCSLYIWNFGLDSPQINISKEPKGRFGLILHFCPLLQNVPNNYHDNNINKRMRIWIIILKTKNLVVLKEIRKIKCIIIITKRIWTIKKKNNTNQKLENDKIIYL